MEKTKKILSKLYHFSGTWTGTVVIVLFLIFFVAQSFVIPSGSMKRTLLIGDFLFAKKFSYGIPTPHLPWLEIPIAPDFDGDGHLIAGDHPKREDIVIFRYPKNEKIHYVKRCIAVGGDEILYLKERLLIHFHEGDKYIKDNYPKEKIIKLKNKLWVINPYDQKYKGIQYKPEGGSSIFEIMLQYLTYNKEIDMHPIYVDGIEDAPSYAIAQKRVNALYKKVEEGHFYMVGDNRDNSNDSRFWGSIPYRLIVGQPWAIYFSIEHRSYEKVLSGDSFGTGRDNARLKAICGEIDIESKECEALWNKERFSIRWGRVGRNISNLQFEEPIE